MSYRTDVIYNVFIKYIGICGYNKTNTTSSVSASILSMTLTVLNFSKLHLTIWWHFIIAFISVLFLFAFLYFFIEAINCFYNKFIKRASIKSEVNQELSDLKYFIDTIYDKDSKYEQVENEFY